MNKNKIDKLAHAMGNHRSRATLEEDIASTVFGKIAEESKETVNIPISKIKVSPFQSRAVIDPEHIESLATSIAESGLVSPIVVRVSKNDTFELIAGHNRTNAFRQLGRDTIPAIVRHMSDAEAARALTVDNTLQKQLTDWELFKHIKMLKHAKFVKNVTDLSNVMGCSRSAIYNLEAFELLPVSIHDLLEKTPSLIGGNLAYDLKQYANNHLNLICQAIDLLALGKIKQAGVIGWIQRNVENKTLPYRKEIEILKGNKKIKMIIKENIVTIEGDIDFEKLRSLIDEKFEFVKKEVSHD